jgi:hypothetical protein
VANRPVPHSRSGIREGDLSVSLNGEEVMTVDHTHRFLHQDTPFHNKILQAWQKYFYRSALFPRIRDTFIILLLFCGKFLVPSANSATLNKK